MTLALDLRGPINTFGQDYTVKRGSAPTYANGFKTPGAESDVVIRALVQPAKSRDLQVLPEGLRNRGTVKLFSVDEIRLGDPSTEAPPDRIVYGGEEWTMVHVDRWGDQGLYWSGMAQKVGR